LQDGDCVQFSRLQVHGHEMNVDYKVKVTGPYTFELPNVDLTGSNHDGNGHAVNQQGYITQIKQPKPCRSNRTLSKGTGTGKFMLSVHVSLIVHPFCIWDSKRCRPFGRNGALTHPI
jgi:hypothetical protein